MTDVQRHPNSTDQQADRRERRDRLPLDGLLALSAAAFLTIMTEALPAGILSAMSDGLGVSESAAGQTVTVYAAGSLVAAIPLTAATRGWNRKRVLLAALSGLVVSNVITAASDLYVATLVARFVGGVVAGLLWALVAGYAIRMVPARQRGRAVAIALAGSPVALSIGVPAGTVLANAVGWRFTFAIMAVLTVALIVWVVASVPDFPGQTDVARTSLRRAVAVPGVVPVMVVTLAFVLAHNLLYTYITPLLDDTRLEDRVDTVLLVFGVFSLLSIWITGTLIDRHLRPLVLISVALFAVATVGLGLFSEAPWMVLVAAATWGLSFGGFAPLLQTAASGVSRDAGSVDVIQSVFVTNWNIGIAGGGIIGGLLLSGVGSQALAWGAAAFLAVALAVAVTARGHAFPRAGRQQARHAVTPNLAAPSIQ